MPEYVVGKVIEALNDECKAVKGSRILVLGVAYKPNVSDVRESPAIDLIHLLREKGGQVNYHDPYVHDLATEGIPLHSIELTTESLGNADCVVIVTHHDSYDWSQIRDQAPLIVDTRHAIKEPGKGRVVYL
jgi:UDP-N-acetyl-D-glucosamine dehydrogenase